MVKLIVSKKMVSIALVVICLSALGTINCFAHWNEEDDLYEENGPFYYTQDNCVECTPSCPQVEDTRMVEYNGECLSDLLEGDSSLTDDVYEEPTQNLWKFID